MGSGPGCDVEYLFGCDILLTTKGHVPRHAKSYRNFQKEFERLQKEREAAFQEFYNDVQSGAFPESKHIIEIKESELEKFLNKLEKKWFIWSFIYCKLFSIMKVNLEKWHRCEIDKHALKELTKKSDWQGIKHI